MKLESKRWLILVISVIINLCIGSGYAWSVFSKPLQAHFAGTDEAALAAAAVAAALVFTISNGVSPVCMITGGKFQDKFGPKWVIFIGGILFGGGIILSGFATNISFLNVSYGIVAGFGMGLVYSSTIANTVKFFPDKRGLVAGIATAGYGLGAVLFAPIANALIQSQDVLFAFKVLGAVYLVVILIGSQFIQTAPAGFKPSGWEPPAVTPTSAVTGVDKTWNKMLADPLFYLLLLMLAFGATSGLMIVGKVAAIAQEIVHVEPAVAALIVSSVAIGNASGRAIWGAISDKIGRYNALPLMYIVSAAAMLLLSQAGDGQIPLFVLCVMLIGFCFGGFMGVFPALTADSFGPKNNGINYGLMFIGFAIGALVGPMLATQMAAANDGDYSMAYYIAAVLGVIGLIITFIVRGIKKKAVANAA